MKVAFLIRALGTGGAERQLTQLACELARRGHEVAVITSYRGLPLHEVALREAGVHLESLAKAGRWDLGFLGTLRRTIERLSPDVLYSFLPTSNVLAALVLPASSKVALIWGVRASNVRKHSYDWLGQIINFLERRMRASPHLVVANSRSGLDICVANGFRSDALRYIPNGIDEIRFRFDEQGRARLRAEWGADGLVVGFAGRLDPMKGIETLIRAIATRKDPIAHAALVIAGAGKASYMTRLNEEASRLGVADRVRWLGNLSDMSAFYSAIDVFCLPSVNGEGTSNAIAEALACGCPCAATRVGDSAALVHKDSLLAEPGDAVGLLRALNAAVDEITATPREALRSGILRKLPFAAAVDATELVLREAVALRSDAHFKHIAR